MDSETLTRKYVTDLITIRDGITATPTPSYPRISTITMAFKINREMDIETLRTKMKESLKIRIKSSEDFIVWKMKENGFYNQITVEFVDGKSKKSVKIFPNGRIHVTGCSDVDDCNKVMHQICFVLKSISEIDMKIESFDIFMINTNFTMNSQLNLQTVINIMKKQGYNISFNPEVYSAVKIKFKPGVDMKCITASIFSSGCVLITGAVNLDEINESYKILTRLLQEACIEPNKTVVEYDQFMGRSFEYWRKFLGII